MKTLIYISLLLLISCDKQQLTEQKMTKTKETERILKMLDSIYSDPEKIEIGFFLDSLRNSNPDRYDKLKDIIIDRHLQEYWDSY